MHHYKLNGVYLKSLYFYKILYDVSMRNSKYKKSNCYPCQWFAAKLQKVLCGTGKVITLSKGSVVDFKIQRQGT